jgi:hypothetical protein
VVPSADIPLISGGTGQCYSWRRDRALPPFEIRVLRFQPCPRPAADVARADPLREPYDGYRDVVTDAKLIGRRCHDGSRAGYGSAFITRAFNRDMK